MYIGMRFSDFDVFRDVAHEYGLIILVRQTNVHALNYIGVRGARNYYPKPALVKAKSAKKNPAALLWKVDGHVQQVPVKVAGLVVHPQIHPGVFAQQESNGFNRVLDYWEQTMRIIAPQLAQVPIERDDPQSRRIWGEEHAAVHAPGWSWRLDMDWRSPHFGCLQLKGARTESRWSYLHGDYDLKDVIVAGKEHENLKRVKRANGVEDVVARLRRTHKTHGVTFSELVDVLNRRMGADMIQHGAEAQFTGHSDDIIAVIYPDRNYEFLDTEAKISAWYQKRDRKVPEHWNK
jgi:hypothetical protein